MRGSQLCRSTVVVGFVLLLSLLPAPTSAQDFDYFYLVLQWPGSYCDTQRSCCYPTTGKPASDFGIHGLWPNYNDGSWPSNCDQDNPFDESKINDLKSTLEKKWPTLACPSGDGLRFWAHEWEKHGTCAESILNQHQYFQTALDLAKKANILQVLQNAGIRPDGGFYNVNSIFEALRQGVGAKVGIQCNKDESRNSQLYEIYICVDNMAGGFIDCPRLPRSRCRSQDIEFPAF